MYIAVNAYPWTVSLFCLIYFLAVHLKVQWLSSTSDAGTFAYKPFWKFKYSSEVTVT